jgi:beta-galactosidase
VGAAEITVLPVTVELFDAQGRVVPVADDRISFALRPARLLGVGNGYPASHEPDQGDRRSAFNGLAQALVQTTSKAGQIVLEASSPQLRAGRVTLRSH